MIKKFLTAVFAVFAMTSTVMAQQDSLYVVKDGKVMGAFEIGKDIDCISFTKPEKPHTGNFVKYGSTSVEMKSAMSTSMNGYTYVFLSPKEGISDDYHDVMGGETDYLMIALPDALVGEEIDLEEYCKNEDADMIQMAYMNPITYEPYATTNSGNFADDGFGAGTLKVEIADDLISVEMLLLNNDSKLDFEASYLGTFVSPNQDAGNTFIVDGSEKKVKATFYQIADGVADLYFTSGAIDDPKRLEDCFYYAHIQLPTDALNGKTLDITKATDFLFDFYDNGNELDYHLAPGNIGKATGTISVKMIDEGVFKLIVNIMDMGSDCRDFSSQYQGEFAIYDTSTPNAYRLQGEEDTKLSSAVATHSNGIYTIYLSAKEGVKTVDGMADADIIVEMPDEFMTNETKGFSGTEENAKISVTYGGVKYNQANCSYVDKDASALGGNARVDLKDGKIDIDFTVFNIYKLNNATLTGHFEGEVTVE